MQRRDMAYTERQRQWIPARDFPRQDAFALAKWDDQCDGFPGQFPEPMEKWLADLSNVQEG